MYLAVGVEFVRKAGRIDGDARKKPSGAQFFLGSRIVARPFLVLACEISELHHILLRSQSLQLLPSSFFYSRIFR